MIDEVEAESTLLMLANEGDEAGLYEAIWEFNSGPFSSSTLGEKYAAAESSIRSLYAKGLIEFRRMVFTDDYKDYQYEPIDPGELDEILSNPVSWYPDYAHVRIVFMATEAGERAYFSGSDRAS